jgi:hypothetical protein
MATMRINCLYLIKRMKISKMQMPSFTAAAWARYFVPNQRTTVHGGAKLAILYRDLDAKILLQY